MEEQNWIRGPVIGRGSTATVSLAITNSGDFFAVKSAELSSSAILQREQTILSSLSSPYVVKYIGFNTTTENKTLMYNLLMEYVPGGSIHDLIKNSGGKLPEPEIRSYTRQILKGLMYLHERGIVHCDLKSENVMVGGETAKIADFGCAKMAGNGSLEFSGTPAFMSPEVARGEEQGFPADVWALGCVVIEMATGSSPWPELNDVVAAIYKIGFTGESPEIPECLSEKGKDFLRKCLIRDPKQRWAVEELLQHPFLEEEEDKTQTQFGCCLKNYSPSTVLDQGFWDSCETSRSQFFQADHKDPFVNSSPADRIKKLVGDENLGETMTEDGWIEVRGNGEIGKRDEEDVDCVEATSSEEDEVGGFEDWILDQEDSLFLEYSYVNTYDLSSLIDYSFVA
ncbi:Mitogen-activated protein kinase kinase kinase 15 [Hirschfeldia incana]|nr:Mitogen-activated protein kinase kinase kinase 15 [Hirschfeldia incana]